MSPSPSTAAPARVASQSRWAGVGRMLSAVTIWPLYGGDRVAQAALAVPAPPERNRGLVGLHGCRPEDGAQVAIRDDQAAGGPQSALRRGLEEGVLCWVETSAEDERRRGAVRRETAD